MTRPTVAVIGASANRRKFGNKAVRAFRNAGYDVYPVNLKAGEIEGLIRRGPDPRIPVLLVYGPDTGLVTERARKLAEEGRIRYVGRTVGSRWLRIRKALEAKEEEILEDEMSDWHDGEVCSFFSRIPQSID